MTDVAEGGYVDSEGVVHSEEERELVYSRFINLMYDFILKQRREQAEAFARGELL